MNEKIKPVKRLSLVSILVIVTFGLCFLAFGEKKEEPMEQTRTRSLKPPDMSLPTSDVGDTTAVKSGSHTDAIRGNTVLGYVVNEVELPTGLIQRVYAISEEEGTKIKALVEGLLKAKADDLKTQGESTVSIDRTSLTLTGTPEAIEIAHKFLVATGYIKRLQTKVFDISFPRELVKKYPAEKTDFAESVMEVIKAFLYAEIGAEKAKSFGWTVSFDRSALQITVTDTPHNLKQVERYLKSRSLGQGARLSEIVYLKHVEAETIAVQLAEVFESSSISGDLRVTKTLSQGDEFEWQDLRIRVRRINANDVHDDTDDDVELIIRTTTQQRDVTITELSSEFIDDYEINITDIEPSTTPGEGRVEFVLDHHPRGEAKNEERLEFIPYPEKNAVLVKYSTSAELDSVLKWIKKLDVRPKLVSVNGILIEFEKGWDSVFRDENFIMPKNYTAKPELEKLIDHYLRNVPDHIPLGSRRKNPVEKWMNINQVSVIRLPGVGVLKGDEAKLSLTPGRGGIAATMLDEIDLLKISFRPVAILEDEGILSIEINTGVEYRKEYLRDVSTAISREVKTTIKTEFGSLAYQDLSSILGGVSPIDGKKDVYDGPDYILVFVFDMIE